MRMIKKILPALTAVMMIAGCSTKDPEPTDPLAAFDHYTNTDGTVEATVCVSSFAEVSDLPVVYTSQRAGLGHAAAVDPDTIEPGASGLILTDYFAKDGKPVTYYIYNSSDKPLAPVDCPIIGFENVDDIIFSNGLRYDSTLEEYIAVLGEPTSIDGFITDDQKDAICCWFDENTDRVVAIIVKQDGDVNETWLYSYKNFTLMPRQEN